MDQPIYWPSVFFLLFGAVACAFAVAVVLSANIVRMAFYLVLSLAATAGLFFLAGADFVGSMQLLIYVGGTLVLLVFGVMLTSQDRFISMKTEPRGNAGRGAGRRVPALRAGLGRVSACRRGKASIEPRPKRFRCSPPPRPSAWACLGIRVDGPDRVGLPAPFRNHFGALAGRADRRRLPGPRQTQTEHCSIGMTSTYYLPIC